MKSVTFFLIAPNCSYKCHSFLVCGCRSFLGENVGHTTVLFSIWSREIGSNFLLDILGPSFLIISGKVGGLFSHGSSDLGPKHAVSALGTNPKWRRHISRSFWLHPLPFNCCQYQILTRWKTLTFCSKMPASLIYIIISTWMFVLPSFCQSRPVTHSCSRITKPH